MSKLVSIIIPCFNAQRWLAEAIDSCLGQTYPNIEIIVVDDGSTDNSLNVIKQYQDKIIWSTGANKGGNYARNKGFTLSSGDYIQYLDADDYLLPEKIEKQVQALESSSADVAYSDWRYQHHNNLSNQVGLLSEPSICGPKEDFLESLLSNDRWVAPSALLCTRAAVEGCHGWDESLKAAQDRGFLFTLALNGAEFVYQPGCDSIYRTYGKVTVSTSCKTRWLQHHCLVMEKAEKVLAESGRLSENYRHALAMAYFEMGREYLYSDYPFLDNKKYQRYQKLLKKVLTLNPAFKPVSNGRLSRLLQPCLGLVWTETVSYFFVKAKTKQWLGNFKWGYMAGENDLLETLLSR